MAFKDSRDAFWIVEGVGQARRGLAGTWIRLFPMELPDLSLLVQQRHHDLCHASNTKPFKVVEDYLREVTRMRKLPAGWSLRVPKSSPKASRPTATKRKKAPSPVFDEEDSNVDESDDEPARPPSSIQQSKTPSAKTMRSTTREVVPVIQLSTKRTPMRYPTRSTPLTKRVRVVSPPGSDLEDIVIGRDLGTLSVFEDARIDPKVLPGVKGQAR